MIPWNVLLWLDPTSSPNARKKAIHTDDDEETPAAPADDLIPRVRLLRFLVGAIASLTGLAAIFVVGMAYRTLADSRLGGALVVVALLAGALALRRHHDGDAAGPLVSQHADRLWQAAGVLDDADAGGAGYRLCLRAAARAEHAEAT
jgi:hypothetical protein